MTQLDKSQYKTLSFDCYGTLIDWERGILDYLQPLLASYDVHVIDEWVLEYFAALEPRFQAEGGSYRTVLSRIIDQFGRRLGFVASAEEQAAFGASVERWQPFPDTVAALSDLSTDFQLVALSNIDDELFKFSAEVMQRPFTTIITAEQVGAYKPDSRMFKALLAEVSGPVLHVAQSRFHDIVPAAAHNLDTVWINRPSLGAAMAADADPTWTFDSMEAFAAAWQ